jgi:hypothetical protein
MDRDRLQNTRNYRTHKGTAACIGLRRRVCVGQGNETDHQHRHNAAQKYALSARCSLAGSAGLAMGFYLW